MYLIINGTENRKIHENIEQYAFVEGFLTCDLHQYLENRSLADGLMLFMDSEGIRKQSKDTMNILFMSCPIILVPASMEDMAELRTRKDCVTELAGFPFGIRNFKKCVADYVSPEILKNRTLYFGDLRINRVGRSICFRDRELNLRGYEYDIFLMLIEHAGDVVPREFINQSLPPRKRNSLRNVDTHIKCIRKKAGMEDIIRSVRPIGYSIPIGQLYKITVGGQR
ncbi:MAG: winged helix-turn-helix domain-containing protein [Oliverpabstia sp.]